MQILHGRSMDNGIILYSKRHNNKIAVATINDNKITTSWIDENNLEQEEPEHKVVQIILMLLFGMEIFIMVYCNVNLSVTLLVKIVLFNVSKIIFFLIFDIDKNTKKFHGAEHQVIHAFNELGRIPSIDELQRYTRFSRTCGTNMMATIGCILLLLAIVPSELDTSLSLLIWFSSIFIINQLNFFQYFTTSNPTEKEQRVAIEAVRVWFENEDKEE